MAQIIVAIQMVTEQKFLMQFDVPPLLAVGLEGLLNAASGICDILLSLGLFGLLIISVMMVPMYYIHVPRKNHTVPY